MVLLHFALHGTPLGNALTLPVLVYKETLHEPAGPAQRGSRRSRCAGDAPRWVYAFCGLACLAYLHLDCLDGKQARRTGSSSPLGQLFDHGAPHVKG